MLNIYYILYDMVFFLIGLMTEATENLQNFKI